MVSPKPNRKKLDGGRQQVKDMKFYITINGYTDVEVATRDLAIFIARKLKEQHQQDEVIVYKDGELVMEVKQ